MARQLRIYFEGAWYHVMNRGVNRETIFFSDDHRYMFLHFLNKTKEIYGIETHAYCLMDNHYHLIVHTPRGNISEAMQYLHSIYARYVNIDIKRDGPLFKGRFKAILINADEYLIELSRYIHLNPLKAKMVRSLLEYKWSSYLGYIKKTKKHKCLNTEEIIKRFGQNNFVQSYKKFVEYGVNQEINLPEEKKNPSILGGKDFCEIIIQYVKAHSLSAEIVGADRILVAPSMQSILNIVSDHFGINDKNISQKSRKIKNVPRNITIYICRRLGGCSLQEIGNMMGLSYKGVSSAIQRVQADAHQLKIANELILQMNNNAKTIEESRKLREEEI